MRAADHARAGGVAVLLVALLAVSWSALYREPTAAHLALLALLALLPLAAWRAATFRRARHAAYLPVAIALVGLAAVAGALATAGRLSVWSLLTLDTDAWAAAAAIVPDGVREASNTSLPLRVDRAPALAGLLDLAFAALAVGLAWQLALRRRPLPAVALLALGLGYRWTVVAPEHPVVWGGVALAAVLLTLRAVRPPAVTGSVRARGAGRAVLVGGALVALSAGLGAAATQGGEGWWDWRSWGAPGSGGSYSLNLAQEYGQLEWADEPVPLFRVTSGRQMPLRAVVLERFEGTRFVEESAPALPLPTEGGRVPTGEDLPAGERSVTQSISLLAGDLPVVLAGGRPVALTGPFAGRVDRVGAALKVDPPLKRGQTYGVETWLPDIGPAELVRTRDYTPGDVEGRLLQVSTGVAFPVEVPLWGSGAPLPAEVFGSYEEVHRLSRDWIGNATSAYQAVNRVESRLRGGYVYDERPPTPPVGTPPLADFLLTTRRGFCQQFAASMALMLRMNGIPARVAVGFTSGRYDAARDSYEVVDRDAHSWVEVWFPEYGWLSFDPTPASGRFAPNRASVSNPSYRAPNVDIQLTREPVRPSRPDPPVRRPRNPRTTDTRPTAPGASGDERGWVLLGAIVAGAVLLGAFAVPGVKLARRTRRRRGGDDRERVLGALREFESTLVDLGMAPDVSLTATERGEALRASSGLDAGDLYRRAAEARFARRPPPPGAAEWCWRESSRLRRDARRAAPIRIRWSLPFRARSLRAAGTPIRKSGAQFHADCP